MNFLFRTITAMLGCSLLFSACLPASNQPVATVIPTVTEPPTASPSPTIPASATPALMTGGDIPCYAGPGADYEVAAVLGIGVKAEVLAKDSGGEYWIIRIPGVSDRCWIETRYATILGTPETIPTLMVESLPTKIIPRVPAPSRLDARASCVPIAGNRTVGTKVEYRILIRLGWPPVKGESGFRLYKEGALVTELDADLNNYDYWLVPEPDMPVSIKLSIEAFNEYGPSEPVETFIRVRGLCKGG